MGCAGSSQSKADGTVKKIRKPKPWKHPQPITKSQLMQLRDEFWDTAPHYGGRKVSIANSSPLAARYSKTTVLISSLLQVLRRVKEPGYNLQPPRGQPSWFRAWFWCLAVSRSQGAWPRQTSGPEIWDALRAAAEADLSLAQAIVDSAGVIVQSADLTICYDERGAKYELPKYVLSEPTNLIREVSFGYRTRSPVTHLDIVGKKNRVSVSTCSPERLHIDLNQKRFSDDVIEDDSVSRRVRSLGLYETVAD
ncbi:hypothetical protein WN944_014340 [Citrus x changshan-huyou]|uniref:DC-UbP/UBTD2 N-terminal domain-containing protein n=1 Tax=Citrus x changshan-huyou TaxID=2935761 RepID=A0AAP0M7P7_9ROSI